MNIRLVDIKQDTSHLADMERLYNTAFPSDERVKRQHFYENAGFVRTGQKMQEATVIYDLMSVGGRIGNKEYRRLMRSFGGLRMYLITLRIFED